MANLLAQQLVADGLVGHHALETLRLLIVDVCLAALQMCLTTREELVTPR
jgi:hypothetical protein